MAVVKIVSFIPVLVLNNRVLECLLLVMVASWRGLLDFHYIIDGVATKQECSGSERIRGEMHMHCKPRCRNAYALQTTVDRSHQSDSGAAIYRGLLHYRRLLSAGLFSPIVDMGFRQDGMMPRSTCLVACSCQWSSSLNKACRLF